MTAARSKISESLAARGRPAMWANEKEAAELSGMSPNRFRAVLPALESRGFPQINPINGRRSIPAILAFWKLPANDPAQEADDERHLENWDDDESQRRAS